MTLCEHDGISEGIDICWPKLYKVRRKLKSRRKVEGGADVGSTKLQDLSPIPIKINIFLQEVEFGHCVRGLSIKSKISDRWVWANLMPSFRILYFLKFLVCVDDDICLHKHC